MNKSTQEIVRRTGGRGTGGDMLLGGSGNDLIIGSKGNDVLWGNSGNDAMAGGEGNDTYILDGSVQVTIEDKIGTNRVLLNGQQLGVFIRQQDGSYITADGKIHGSFSGTDFIVTDDQNAQITLNADFQEGDFGITFKDAPVDPVYTTTITGDIIPTDASANPGIQPIGDANGNPTGEAGAYADLLKGTVGNDHIVTGELNDEVFGLGGDDWIEGGNGNDYIIGDDAVYFWANGIAGNDIIEGGADADILIGNAGDDWLFGETNSSGDLTQAVADAVLQGSTATGTGLKGDWLNGGEGEDTLIGSDGNDVLTGGAGTDLIVAGAGDDYILGDADYTPPKYWPEGEPGYLDMSVTLYYPNGDALSHTSPRAFDWAVNDTGDTVDFGIIFGEYEPADSAADTIYAGNGNDRVWAGKGDDIVYGEGGDDHLGGEDGNDILFGGAGNDMLFGGTGKDRLYGDLPENTAEQSVQLWVFKCCAANDKEGWLAA
ncbi:MAG: hypothetical protein KJ899_13855 [Gammaproteobacteria bacterium]|nr:hypothetical protein [Gammaproteobacteria bacterium]